MSDVHYFPRYSQRENVVTNNTLLLLLRLYDYDRFKFGRFLRELLGEELDFSGALGLQFKQQRGTGASVVDGFIAQESITIVVETKRDGETFDSRQLDGHLGAFRNEGPKLLVLLSPTGDTLAHQVQRPLLDRAKQLGVTVFSMSFEMIIDAARASLSGHDEETRALVEDFAVFCSDEQLLPRDKCTMFVPPCGASFDDNVEFSLYYCPATRKRRRTAYLGVYKDKMVQKIGRITKVVACDVDVEREIVTPIDPSIVLTPEDSRRIVGVTQTAAERRGWFLQRDHQFFLCDHLEDTAFCKNSPGGIQGHRYLDLADILKGKVPADIADLGRALRDVTWK